MSKSEAVKLSAVITSIQGPTPCVRRLAEVLKPLGTPLHVIGDSKGPFTYDLENAKLWTLAQQQALNLQIAGLLPTKHYARKNIGYLIAINVGSQCIYETDDDNAPKDNWKPRSLECEAVTLTGGHWVNVYRWFSSELIWPRGLPLEYILDESSFPKEGRRLTIHSPIQQGLADRSPDVDAVWRLVLDRDFTFEARQSAFLPPGSWCPFNSQTTWWWPDAYPLLYLPSYCSFRMTDIWRSFVSQRCLWELETGLIFHSPEVDQERNVHSLAKDFEAEVPGYLNNKEITQTLESLSLSPGRQNVSDNLVRCYEALIDKRFLPPDEMPLVRAWVHDVTNVP